ncbi:aminotransferase class I/II-fold pyridoxal phosphate-dependent enzyme [Diaphorobacter caeni]|uniref:aminotransferase class I/II-fold pyridoxal phosphate-dependent enzyme n=1 Tax=Diaphorobacter caeni TaxID=2784387 RepID=UPI00188F5775|nr:aminotransferase class I/II-fold pyridoxal phosphate-dependent enzyme [Diaphorobacter caeni]MBF5006499.1 aminotransferase class I/II-fold pyridoxal phosphate-dependent enzyme [Diaphorobacter caeni]
MLQVIPESIHGGPDAEGVPLHDFSTNANACGPCKTTQAALRNADAAHYPDPHYTRLRARLGAFHGVEADRIVLAASASEFMQRISAFAARIGIRHARVPQHGYGDYTRGARIWGLELAASDAPALHWACEPASPLGSRDEAVDDWLDESTPTHDIRVLDCAYVPLMLDGAQPRLPSTAWQLWTPNKALALTGVRAAYAIAPTCASAEHLAVLRAMSASWPIGSHGVAMLESWVTPEVQHWLHASLVTLSDWKRAQIALCASLGWSVRPGSLANYFTAQLPQECRMDEVLVALRKRGIKLRDCASFGLPRHVRVGVLSPQSQAALKDGWTHGGFA